jgi:hypothetical protein
MFGAVLFAGISAAVFISLFVSRAVAACGPVSASASDAVVIDVGGAGQVVGATEYGGPGDPSSGTIGASGVDLLAHPDSYAELGGDTFATATAMGGLPYMTPLRITWGAHSAIAYKRDIGRGGGPVDGRARVIDMWWQLATSLGVPYDHGLWSGLVRVARPPGTGSANLLGGDPSVVQSASAAAGSIASASAGGGAGCMADAGVGVPLSVGQRAVLLPDGRASAPAGAPPAVKGVIAAGNQIVGVPYAFGAAHGLPLSELVSAYDCSSSVEHLLFGGGLLPATYDSSSSGLESFGAPGPGRWITLYANAAHVFMYVAGLRWDTWDAAGRGDGSAGIGWHPLVRDGAGFVARHPVGL